MSEDESVKFASRPMARSKGYVSRRRAAAINTVNWMIQSHPKSVIRLLRALSCLYGEEATLEDVANDLENAYDEGFVTQGDPEKRRENADRQD